MVERRLTILAGIVLIWGGAVLFNILSLQVVRHREFERRARARQEIKIATAAPRGAIFDRSGRVLAMSLRTDTVYINPLKVDVAVAARILAGVLNLDAEKLFETIDHAAKKGRGYLIVKRHISREEKQRLKTLGLEWIDFQRESRRHYPKGHLAAHVLGSVDHEERGNAGIEKFFDADLRGTPGEMRLLTDVKRRALDSTLATEGHAGTPITLTIDERLQFVAERDLEAAVRKKNATSGSVVLMDPRTGDILALASYPAYDPNIPPRSGDSRIARNNHAVSVPFEPGSVFKVITLAAALETTSLTPESMINCHGGVLRLPGRVVHDHHQGLGVIPMATVLAKSSNVGAIEVGTRVGQQNMYDYVRRFGFGQKTGIPLPAESGGKVRRLANWGLTSLASIAMGQEISATTVQLAQAASVIANGGLLVRPRLVLKQGDRTIAPQPPVRVIKAETAITMRQMMEGVVLRGTGTAARLDGYTVGGKTGSAQIFDVAAHRYTHTYNGSFLGFAPVTNPGLVAVITLNGTRGTSGFGGAAAAPVFHTVATEALRVLDIPKDLFHELPVDSLVTEAAVADLADADENTDQPNILEEGDEDELVGQAPGLRRPPGPPSRGEQGIDSSTAERVQGTRAAQGAAPRLVPNFKGKTMRAVLAEAAAKGLTVLTAGSGVARGQEPAAGAILQQGERIRVQFAR